MKVTCPYRALRKPLVLRFRGRLPFGKVTPAIIEVHANFPNNLQWMYGKRTAILVKWIRVQFNLSNLSINSNLNRFASDLLRSLGDYHSEFAVAIP